MLRERLPDRRRSVVRKVSVGGQTVYFNVGLYPDGRPGEVFVDINKAGSAVRAWSGATAKLLSLMLQYGVPLCEVVDALEGTCSAPWGEVAVRGHPGIDRCFGELDYIAKALVADFADHCEETTRTSWDALADALDRLFSDGEVDIDDVREQMEARGADEALEALLEATEDA